MDHLPLYLAAVALLLTPAFAASQEGKSSPDPGELKLRPKVGRLEAPPVPERAPFLLQPGEPVLDLALPRVDDRLRESRSSCDRAGQSLCYDPGSGKVVYKKTREYMPELPGLSPEHISVKRDRVTFKYSF